MALMRISKPPITAVSLYIRVFNLNDIMACYEDRTIRHEYGLTFGVPDDRIDELMEHMRHKHPKGYEGYSEYEADIFVNLGVKEGLVTALRDRQYDPWWRKDGIGMDSLFDQTGR